MVFIIGYLTVVIRVSDFFFKFEKIVNSNRNFSVHMILRALGDVGKTSEVLGRKVTLLFSSPRAWELFFMYLSVELYLLMDRLFLF